MQARTRKRYEKAKKLIEAGNSIAHSAQVAGLRASHFYQLRAAEEGRPRAMGGGVKKKKKRAKAGPEYHPIEVQSQSKGSMKFIMVTGSPQEVGEVLKGMNL